MGFLLQIYVYLFGYEYAKRKFNKKSDLKKEKGVRTSKGVKGVRDSLREIEENISKNESSN